MGIALRWGESLERLNRQVLFERDDGYHQGARALTGTALAEGAGNIVLSEALVASAHTSRCQYSFVGFCVIQVSDVVCDGKTRADTARDPVNGMRGAHPGAHPKVNDGVN